MRIGTGWRLRNMQLVSKSVELCRILMRLVSPHKTHFVWAWFAGDFQRVENRHRTTPLSRGRTECFESWICQLHGSTKLCQESIPLPYHPFYRLQGGSNTALTMIAGAGNFPSGPLPVRSALLDCKCSRREFVSEPRVSLFAAMCLENGVNINMVFGGTEKG